MNDQARLCELGQSCNNTVGFLHRFTRNQTRRGDDEKQYAIHTYRNSSRLRVPFCVKTSITLARMSEINIADLLALDTASLKDRLSELRRYL